MFALEAWLKTYRYCLAPGFSPKVLSIKLSVANGKWEWGIKPSLHRCAGDATYVAM